MEKKLLIADIKHMIQKFVELTVDETLTGYLDPRADKTWNEIVEMLNKLGE